MIHTRNAQKGSTLLVAMIMLIALTLFAVSAINLSTTNLHIVGNMQARAEAAAAGQQALEQVISSNFTVDPTTVSAASPIAVTIGGVTYNAVVTAPVCQYNKPLLNSDLNFADPKDQPCFSSGTAQNTGIVTPSGTGSTQSWCYKQQWEAQSTVTDIPTGTAVVQHQGVTLRVPVGTSC